MTHLALKDELLDAQTAARRWDGPLRRRGRRRVPCDGPRGGRHRSHELALGLDVNGDAPCWRWPRASIPRAGLESARLALLPGVELLPYGGDHADGRARWTRGWSRATPGRPAPSGPAPRCSGSRRRSC